RLAAVLELEIIVAPALEARVGVIAECVERALAGGVEMPRVILEAIAGRQVHAPAKPPDERVALVGRGKETQVHVHRRTVGIARMQHERYAHRLVSAAGKLRT